MNRDPDDDMNAAEDLAARDSRAAAEAFSAIACDSGVGDELRLSAAEQLAQLDQVQKVLKDVE